jgi:hypothetical protein
MSYNLCQQTFALSMQSNMLVSIMGSNRDTKGSLEEKLRRHIDDFLADKSAEIGAWEVVWGPAVYMNLDYQKSTDGKGIADNATYVARKKDGSVYVVATAGTNMNSEYAKKVEDADVGDTITFKKAFEDVFGGGYGDPPGGTNPCLSMGTALGAQAVLTTPPEAITKMPVRLGDFLAKVVPSGATLIITGHSLGGALSPAIALALFNDNNGPLKASDWGAVKVMPTAGATPGNQGFADAFAHKFQPTPFNEGSAIDMSTMELWNRDIVNQWDIVPLAWVPTELDTVPPDGGYLGLYPQLQWMNDDAKKELKNAVAGLKAKANAGARSTPAGAAAGVKAGAYTRLARAMPPATEVEPDAKIYSLGGEVADGSRVTYVDHWKLQHIGAYIQQIFKIGDVLSSDQKRKLVQGLGGGLFEGKGH